MADSINGRDVLLTTRVALGTQPPQPAERSCATTGRPRSVLD